MTIMQLKYRDKMISLVYKQKLKTNFFGREQGVWNRTDTNYDFTWASRERQMGNLFAMWRYT